MRSRPREDGLLSIIEVNPASGKCVTSVGEELVVPGEKFLALVEQVCQEQAAVILRTWWTPDGVELVELYRAPSDGWQPKAQTKTEAF